MTKVDYDNLFKDLPKKKDVAAICDNKFVANGKMPAIMGLSISERIDKKVKASVCSIGN